MENDRDTSLQSWEFLTLFPPRLRPARGANAAREPPLPAAAALRVGDVGADFYSVNFHKWLYAPRPAGALVVDMKRPYPWIDAAALGDLLADQRMTVLVVAFRTHGTAVPTPASRAHSAASLQLC